LATKTTSFKFTDTDLELIDSLSSDMGCSRTQAIRIAVRDLRKARGLYVEKADAFVASLRAKYPEDAILSVELDSGFDAFASIDGVRQDGIYIASMPEDLRYGEGAVEHFVAVSIGDLSSDVRILLGLLPMRTGVPLHLPLARLEPDMNPVAAAYWVAGE
jgi:hypothetical protein